MVIFKFYFVVVVLNIWVVIFGRIINVVFFVFWNMVLCFEVIDIIVIIKYDWGK